jgi:hypothetical protein
LKRQRFPSLKAGTLSPETYLYKVSREIPKYRAATRISITSGVSCILFSAADAAHFPAPAAFPRRKTCLTLASAYQRCKRLRRPFKAGLKVFSSVARTLSAPHGNFPNVYRSFSCQLQRFMPAFSIKICTGLEIMVCRGSLHSPIFGRGSREAPLPAESQLTFNVTVPLWLNDFAEAVTFNV